MKYCVLAGMLLSVLFSEAQLKKNQILLGGAGNFSRQKANQEEAFFKQEYKETQLTLEPKVGLFVIERLAIGIKGGYQHVNQDQYLFSVTPLYESETYSYSKVNQFAVGPFVRYYFLPEKKKINVFSEAGLTFGGEKTKLRTRQVTGPVLGTGGQPTYSESTSEAKSNVHTFSIQAGPVLFLGPNVSFELSLGYSYAKIRSQSRNGIAAGTGFVVYLK